MRKRILQILLGTLLMGSLSLLGAVALIWTTPQKVLDWGLEGWLHSQLRPTVQWNSLRLSSSGGMVNRVFRIEASEVEVLDSGVQVSVNNLLCDISLSLSRWDWRVENLDVGIRRFQILTLSDSKEEKSGPVSVTEIVEQVRGIFAWNDRLRAGSVTLEEFVLKGDEPQLEGSAVLQKRAEDQPLNLEFEGRLKQEKRWAPLKLGANITEGSQGPRFSTQLKIDLKPTPLSLEISADLKAVPVTVRIAWKGGAEGLDGELEGKLGNGEAHVEVNRAKWKPDALNQLEILDPCRFNLAWGEAEDRVKSTCQVSFTTTFRSLKPTHTVAKLDLNVGLKDEKISGRVEVDLSSLEGGWYGGTGGGWGEFTADVKDISKSFVVTQNDVKLRLNVQEFQKVVQLLSATKFPVPRPFSALKGEVVLGVRGEVLQKNGSLSFPVFLETKLASPRQHLELESKGELQRSQDGIVDLRIGVNARNVELVAPPISLLTERPAMVSDGRFVDPDRSLASEKAEPSKFHYQVAFRSLSKNMLIHWSGASTPIPVWVDLKIVDGLVTGQIKVRQTEVKLFGREAVLESLVLSPQNKDTVAIAGKVRSQRGQYRLYLEIQGTTARPQLRFYSEPPLSNEEITSLLLFGRSPDRLSASETDSVGNFSSAVSESALNFLSLLALSSTPIESIGFNPQSGTVTAQLKIGEGSQLVLGSNLSSQHRVGIQQRLDDHWWVNSYLDTDSNLKERAVSTFLEWLTRY